ncbi:MAG: hypothetical protein JXB30_09715 [Anaerolineae bacterium]|nr:hypothetical protein [Anaerolineae bacterium]
MAEPITLTLPDDISDWARQIAETTSRSVEQVVIEHLKNLSVPLPELPPDEQAELDALHQLSDDALWTIAREQVPDEAQTRAQQLMEKNSRGEIADMEAAELAELVRRADRVMLRKAEAAAILQKRGYAFSQEDFRPQYG